MRAVFAIFILYVSSVQAQDGIIFYSNLEERSILLDKRLSGLDDNSLISLGDNQIEDYKVYTDVKKSVIGDKDISKYFQQGVKTKKKLRRKALCPGPEIEELDENHVVIRINSNWFLDEQFKFLAADEDCDVYNQIHELEELEDVLDDYKLWNKIIIAHHPITSISELSGFGLGFLHFVPIYGQLRTSYKSYSGNSQDISNKAYQKYIHLMDKLLEGHDRLVFLTGHDRLNTVLQKNNHSYININTGHKNYRYKRNEDTRFVSAKSSILSLEKIADNYQFRIISEGDEEYLIEDPFQVSDEEIVEKITVRNDVDSTTFASQKYFPTRMNTFWYGEGYRKEWSTKVYAQLLSDTLNGEIITPYAIGGGLQTMSVKFKSSNGKKYAFRALDKQPEKSLSEVFRESAYKNVVQELITTMHPYGPLMVDALLDATDIIHISPALYILDNSPSLGSKYGSYAGKIGTLEEKPKGKKKRSPGFNDADKVVSTYEMLLQLRKSPNHQIDNQAYARARIMDMFVGDWDRHEDNWKWARYDDGDNHTYKPIPKDRDHVFSHWTGVIPSVADIIIMNAEDFDYTFGNLRQLNFKARFLDRQLGTELSLEDWLVEVAYIQEKMTDEVIEHAVLSLPKEVRSISGQEIVAKLKNRRVDLTRAMTEYYSELANEVHIAATNKKDRIHLAILENQDVEVTIYKENTNNKEPYFARILEHKVVDKTYLYGLDGSDRFEIVGDTELDMQIIIVGGSDIDVVDLDNIKNEKHIKVYDSNDEDLIEGSANPSIKRPKRVAHYDPYAFDFNFFSPKIGVRRSSGNGFGIGAGFTYQTRGYNKKGFVNKYDVFGFYYPHLGAYRVDWKYMRNQGFRKSDVFISGRIATLYDKYPFYYGIGNNTVFDRNRRRKDNRIDYQYYDVKLGFENKFYNKSSWTNLLSLECHDVSQYKNVEVSIPTSLGFGRNTFLGYSSRLLLDFTDKSNYPTAGSILDVDIHARSSIEGKVSGNINSRFSYFKTYDLGVETTFIGSLHFKQALGESTFYHLSGIGSQSHFRGYTRNRFIDKYAALYNTECRVSLGYIKTPLIRFYVGVFGFYDGGRVWNDSSEFYQGEWNNSYGGGFFISPGTKDFSLTYTLARPDDNFTYSKFQLGFDF